jgi:glycine/D-amino acid oxidase-like deaminating enzyme
MQHVAIAGGGVIGAATAYFLALRGVRSTIVERRSVAAGASGTAAGLLSPPAPADLLEPWGAMGADSLALHFEVARALDGPSRYGFESLDTALVARNQAEHAAIAGTYGSGAWLEAPALRAHSRWFGDGIVGGVVRRGGAQLFPDQFTRTLIEAAQADVRAGAVDGVARDGHAAIGLLVEGVRLQADAVVLAMGPWTADASAWLDHPIPVMPLKGQILRLRIAGAPPAGFADLDGQYLVRKPNGIVYAGTTEEDAGFDETPTPDAESAILAWASANSPIVANAEVLERTACLRPLSADNVPIIGAVPGLAGAYLATGHGRKGILLSLATGKALAELIVDGAATSIDLAPFSPTRFVAGAVN